MDYITKIKELSAAGKTVKYIRAYLTMEEIDDKNITELLKEAGIGRSGNGGLTYPAILEYLSITPRTERELFEKVLFEGTSNENNWINERNKIRKVLNSVFSKFGENITEELASKELKDSVKLAAKKEPFPYKKDNRESRIEDAWNKLKEAKADRSKAKRNEFHPDKISYLEDEELIAAYDEFFKTFPDTRKKRAA